MELTFTLRELQDSARDRPLNLLFQVIKRSKTRGDVKMTLRVGPTSLDRVDGERLQHRVSSLPLLSVEKVYLFTDDATQVTTLSFFVIACSCDWLFMCCTVVMVLVRQLRQGRTPRVSLRDGTVNCKHTVEKFREGPTLNARNTCHT